MRLSEILKSSLATMRMNGRRTFLTMIGIVIGIAAVITIMSLGNGFQKETMDSLTDDQEGRVSQNLLFQPSDQNFDPSRTKVYTPQDIQLVEDFEGVSEAKVDDQDNGMPTNVTVKVGKETESQPARPFKETSDDLVAGRNLQTSDSESYERNVLISENLAKKYFGQADQAVDKNLTINGKNFTVVGVFASEGPATNGSAGAFTISSGPELKMPEKTMEIYNLIDRGSLTLKVYFDEGADSKKIMDNIVKKLNAEGSKMQKGQYMFFDMSKMLEGVGQTLNMVTYFISAVAGISLLVAGVGVMNMMYISVSERTQEIGIRRSLGATQSNIQKQFLFEGIAITTVGGVIGYILGILLAYAIASFLPFGASVDFGTALLAVLISVLIGIIFSVFPARAAAQKNVVDILR
ncbi:FtsX-like permease family protein [Aerococcus sanguinicola]|uniref:FtsX-like permease family protein n=1 Tax=Aerococcus sanguinicola TaxID=119206 RepID=A0A5N1GK61_9LACT|nr:ABC transporter permease [Aerococcus sanguinicola]KAA9300579.1 FtsX-like permease family protein [Aerococcus sanguinicola]